MAKDTAEVRKQIEEARSTLKSDLDEFGPAASEKMQRARHRVIEIGTIIGTGLALVLIFPILKLTRHRRERSKASFRSRSRSFFKRR